MKLIVAILIGLIFFLFSPPDSLASLELIIDLSSQEFDWVDGTGIIKTSGIDDNRFGVIPLIDDATISYPLADYSGNGIHYAVKFDFSSDFSVIEGIGLSTTLAPGNPTSFSGTPQGPTSAFFTTGDFSAFTNLSLGTFNLAPVSEWSDGITVTVTPEPTTLLLLGLGGLMLRKKK